MCWWGYSITSANFPTGTNRYEYFYSPGFERIRVAIAWWSRPDFCTSEANCGTDSLDTDLDVTIYSPSNLYVSSSLSFDNNYELIDFNASEAGTYSIKIYKSIRTTESDNHLGIAVVRQPIRQYVPTILKDSGSSPIPPYP